ncbi:MAG TPA: hypothetical protein PJ981_16390, partial [Accumulibacter sp.]|nr:hypothetical protein [Accumulibacter sp.]
YLPRSSGDWGDGLARRLRSSLAQPTKSKASRKTGLFVCTFLRVPNKKPALLLNAGQLRQKTPRSLKRMRRFSMKRQQLATSAAIPCQRRFKTDTDFLQAAI